MLRYALRDEFALRLATLFDVLQLRVCDGLFPQLVMRGPGNHVASNQAQIPQLNPVLGRLL
jgi:hypothetical protein